MGFDSDAEPSPTPKLSLFWLPSKPHESSGLSTPIHTSASVPFKWEEAPGKPRPCTNHHNQPKCKTAVRCLELPPRLLNEGKVSNMPSPTTVFDGPYKGQWNGKSFSSLENSGRRGKTLRTSVIFGSGRWGSFTRNKEIVGDSFDFSCQVFDGSSDHGHDGVNKKVKMTKFKRKSSFLGFSSTRSHLWKNIYEGFKQVVPWKIGQRN